MNKCKFCQEELAEDSTVCPHCGKDNAEEETATQTAEEAASAGSTEETATAEETVSTEETMPTEETASAGESVSTEEGVSAEEVPSTEIQEGIKATPGKIALAIAAVVVLLAALIALVVTGLKDKQPQAEETAGTAAAVTEETVPATIPADGNPNDVTCKGSYTAEEEAVLADRDTVVATMGEYTLTNSQLQVYYWMEVQGFLSNYGAYASYFGLDYTQPLDTQVCPQAEGQTWQQYFLQCALNNWQQMQAMSAEAEATGTAMDAESREYLDKLDDTLAEIADAYEISVEELLLSNFGPSADKDDYRHFQELYHTGYPYYEAQVAKLVPTEKDLEDFYAAHEADYANSGVSKDDTFVDVRHILLMVEGGTTGEDGTTTYTDEEWEACRLKAQAVLDEWLAGAKTEDSFAALATEKTEDPGSQSTGGLYEQVYPGQMVTAFNDWCFDASRQPGDYGLVKTEYGYHVMYFVKNYPQWKYYAESDWVSEQTNNMISSLLERYPMEVSYDKIRLGLVDMG